MTEIDYSAAEEKPSWKSRFSNLFKSKPAAENAEPSEPFIKQSTDFAKKFAQDTKDDAISVVHTLKHELTPPDWLTKRTWGQRAQLAASFIALPYFPAFYRPGWLTNYAIGFVTPSKLEATLESAWDDIWAGITVSLCLIPQGISYAGLANLPAIRGLYAAVLPSSVYTFFGSSLQLAVGPVAIVSLLVGKVVILYNLAPVTGEATAAAAKRAIDAGDLAAQTMICLGIILVAMSLINLGSLIRFVSQPVFSGFTTGAAMTIGLSQLKNAMGFTYPVPQSGDLTTHYNYEVMNWYVYNWNTQYTQSTKPKSKNPNDDGKGKYYRNIWAERIFGGLLVPLLLIAILKDYLKKFPAIKKNSYYRLFTFFANISPLIAMIIGARLAYDIQTNNPLDYYARQLKTIGDLNAGIYDLIRIPNINQAWGKLFIDVIPLTLIAFMESYSVARKIAVERNELHILNCNQELWAIGAANLIGSVGSGYPVAGSFSRSSLNAASGARTPLSKAACMLVIVLVISTLTSTLNYVPTCANSAVIWAALWNLIDFTDLWETFKVSKQDFVTQISALVITFIIDTETGLACGMGLSIIFLLYEIAFSHKSAPYTTQSTKDSETIRLNNDLNFFSIYRIKDYIAFEILLNRPEPVKKITLDFIDVKHVDKSAFLALNEIYYQAESQEVAVEIINLTPDVLAFFDKNGVKSAVIISDEAAIHGKA